MLLHQCWGAGEPRSRSRDFLQGAGDGAKAGKLL